METAGANGSPPEVRGESRALLYGFSEYHIDRRIRSYPLLARTAPR
jgi:hypothetical protein